MAVSLSPANFSLFKGLPSSPSMKRGVMWKPLSCSALPIQQSQEQVTRKRLMLLIMDPDKADNSIGPESNVATEGIMCDSCNGVGWLVCDFCQGKKTNVKSESNRIYRRCPSCRAVGYVLCTKCKVYKCVTFPDFADCEGLSS